MNNDLKARAVNNMAMTNLIMKGVENMQKVTDEEIDQLEGNDLMSKEFIQDLVKRTREMSNWTVDEIMIYIQENFIFDKVISKERYESIFFNLLCYAQDHNMYEMSREAIIDDLIEDGDITEDELKIIDDDVYEEYQEWKGEDD